MSTTMRISITCLTLLVCIINTDLVLCATNSDFSRFDIFQVLNLNGYNYRRDYRMMNDILERSTRSIKPEDNFDVLFDNLIRQIKLARPSLHLKQKAINLFLALATINKENQCSPYSVKILTENDNALNNRLRSVKPGSILKRTETIVALFLKKHAYDCLMEYYGRFNWEIGEMDRDKLRLVEQFLDDAIKHYTNEPQETFSLELTKTYVHRLYNIVDGKVFTLYAINTDYIYKNLKELAKDDSEAKYLLPIYDEIAGNDLLNPGKFTHLFRKYISEPCSYYTRKLGPTIFDLINFDAIFYHRIQERLVDFYEAWVRHKLCSTKGLNDKLITETITAVNKEAANKKKVADQNVSQVDD